MSVTVTHRETCRLCDSGNVELVVKLAPIPLSESYAQDSETGANAPRFPVDLYMCADCGHVQQLDVVDSKSLWENYTYFSGEAKGMPEHFNEVSENIRALYNPSLGSLVVDVGSNDGALLRPFKQAGHRVLGIDPATAIARMATESGIETIPELMSLDLARRIRRQYGPAEVVCMFNAFAHADNLGEVVDAIRTLLSDDGVFIFEAQYLLDIVDGMLIASIFHEHISHHSVKALVQFLDRHGMELIKVERVPIQHGSIIGSVQLKGGSRKVDPSVNELLALESQRGLDKLETLRQFGARVYAQRDKLIALVKKWKQQNTTVAGYGAARSGPTLISQLGLTGALDYIVDDHPQKVQKYSSGDGIQIVPTAELCQRMPEFTVILAWVHSAKIIAANREYLDKGGHFVVLCPETRIVGRNGDIRLEDLI
ncbi:MAG: methyltransferase domain-containing protein [Verrucomicrobia bacterium]|nr:methyltransferase domain-containing protein [Verrucomicrobiota bacterium]